MNRQTSMYKDRERDEQIDVAHMWSGTDSLWAQSQFRAGLQIKTLSSLQTIPIGTTQNH